MAIYVFECRHDLNHGCGHIFEITCAMDEISSIKPECPRCGLQDSVFREWSMGAPQKPMQTLGGLADRKADKLSNDEKKYLNEKYKTKKNGKFYE